MKKVEIKINVTCDESFYNDVMKKLENQIKTGEFQRGLSTDANNTNVKVEATFKTL